MRGRLAAGALGSLPVWAGVMVQACWMTTFAPPKNASNADLDFSGETRSLSWIIALDLSERLSMMAHLVLAHGLRPETAKQWCSFSLAMPLSMATSFGLMTT